MRRYLLFRTFLLALVSALAWWLIALGFHAGTGVILWIDQRATFTQGLHHLGNPYAIPNFVYPPWAVLLIAPFSLFPLSLAVLLQFILYFWLLTVVIIRFGGSFKTALLTLTSPMAFDTALELNIDWIVVIGLFVPRLYSGPLLMVKPQDAFGYWLSFGPRSLSRGAAVILVVLVLSFALWGFWPPDMAAAIDRANTLGRGINIAPSHLMSWPVSLPIGGVLAAWAFFRRDPVLGVIAGIFFVPYLTIYSLLIPFAFVAIRWPRFALLFSVVVWSIYGAYALAFVL